MFPVCDRYFASVMAQTYPNRRFLMAGPAGQIGDPLPSPERPQPPVAGFGTIFDLLNAYQITLEGLLRRPTHPGLFPYVVEQNVGRVRPSGRLLRRLAPPGACRRFSLVDPESFEGSEENPQDVQAGAYYVYRIIDAVMQSPGWR